MKDRAGLIAELRDCLAAESSRKLEGLARSTSPEDIAVALRALPDEDVERVLSLLRHRDSELSGEILSLLDSHDVRRILEHLPDEDVADVLEELPPDDATAMVELLDQGRVDAVVDAMEESESREVRERLEFPEDSAGRLMSDEFLALPLDATAGEAISRLQQAGENVTVIYVYLVDAAGRLAGVVSLRRLLRVQPETALSELTPRELVSAFVLDDQEEVAELVEQHDLICVPVMGDGGMLEGVITHDDVIDVLREEATEDILKMAGTTAEDAEAESPWRSARLRMPWLLFCLTGGVVSARLLGFHEARLGSLYVALAAFVPVIVGMGGNVGTQSATLIVRGLATGRIQRHDHLRILWNEVRTAALVGLSYGVLLALVAHLMLGQGPTFSFVLGLALGASMIVAATFGTVLPILFQAIDVDPAVATGPLVTTGIDVLGIALYLGLAGWLLGVA